MMIYALIYWLSIKGYYSVLWIASFFHPKAKLFIKGRKHLLSKMREDLAGDARTKIWMHCASLGEFEQGRPVLEQIKKHFPDYAIMLTFFSPSGYEVRKNYEGADYVYYLPVDGPANAAAFLNIVRPSYCIFVKYELWYFYLSAIAKRHIPAILISANFRKDQPFFMWYGKLHRKMLRCFTHIFVQNRQSLDLLKTIDVNNVTISGDTRFDRVLEAVQQQSNLPIAAEFAAHAKVIVAGSTWPEDEAFLHKVMQLLPPHWKLIVVPHEVNAAHIRQIEDQFAGMYIKWTDAEKQQEGKRILIVDKVGLLLQLYRYATIAWVGGGFGKEGVHNVLEAAVYGMPVGYGPIFDKFIEAKELIDAGGGISTTDPALLAENIIAWENDNAAYQQVCNNATAYVSLHGGATQKIMYYLLSEKNSINIP